MAKQKKQKNQFVIIHEQHVDVNRLLPYKTDVTKPKSTAAENTVTGKKEMPLFYDGPIHKAKKHDLF
jgi:hypothetical protein